MKKMLLSVMYCCMAIISTNIYADDNNAVPALNTVTLQLKSEQWLVTKTALVTIVVNAALSDQGIDKIQTEVMQKLSQVAKTDWHVVSFNRQQDKTGLEGVTIRAQARVMQSDMSGLRNAAKSISKPGETFSVDNVEFTPTEDETRNANSALRNDIYQQAKRELDVLNNIYPAQKYYLHQIDFTQTPIVMPMAAAMYTKSAAAPLSVGNKAELQATVVLAAMPELPTNLPRAH
jgi:hypothetical protein